jgi:Flp pilus assembly protein TadB
VASEREIPDETVPPAGESVHLPGPTLLPVVVAAGITIAVVGVVLTPALAALGLLITVVAIVRWVREVRADMAELPQEH